MQVLKSLFFGFIFFSTAHFLWAADEIYANNGNIFYLNTQITNSGKDRLPIISPDKKIIVFVRTGTEQVPEECHQFNQTDNQYADQIWIYDVENKKEYLLVASKFACDKPEDVIVNIHDLKFSLDLTRLYFLTSAWNESDALHVVNLDGTKQHYLAQALEFEIVDKGDYQGHLLIKQRRYFSEGQSFDWYWLYTAEGKELSPIGPEITEIKKENIETNN